MGKMPEEVPSEIGEGTEEDVPPEIPEQDPRQEGLPDDGEKANPSSGGTQVVPE